MIGVEPFNVPTSDNQMEVLTLINTYVFKSKAIRKRKKMLNLEIRTQLMKLGKTKTFTNMRHTIFENEIAQNIFCLLFVFGEPTEQL